MKIGLEQFKTRLVERVDLATASAVEVAEAAQDVGRELVTPAQEEAFAETVLDTFSNRLQPTDPVTAATWAKVRAATSSPFPAPQVIGSILVVAQADSRNLLLGKDALQGELADPNVLTFAMAHEEAHRQHRDTAGVRGLATLVEAAPKALPVMRAGLHQNELEADEFAGRAAGRLGCDPKPILKYLVSIPEDAEHPHGLTRAWTVKDAMAAEGRQVSPRDWAGIALPGSTDDPGTWAPLYADRSVVKPWRQEYLQAQPGTLVVMDQFANGGTHGAQVRDAARGEGFQGKVLEMDSTFSLEAATNAQLDAMVALEEKFLAAADGDEARQALRDLSVLRRTYTLDRTAEQLDQLTSAGVRNCAINLSHGSNAAEQAKSILTKAAGADAARWLIGLLKAFPGDWQAFVNGDVTERARLVREVSQFFQDVVLDPRWQASKARYDAAVERVEAQPNSVVVAAGNEGEVGAFLDAWAGAPVPRPEGFEHNDLGNSRVTLVGVQAPYCSHNPEIDVYADGQAVGADEVGTSYAAPRVAQRLAVLHGAHPGWTSAEAEQALSRKG